VSGLKCCRCGGDGPFGSKAGKANPACKECERKRSVEVRNKARERRLASDYVPLKASDLDPGDRSKEYERLRQRVYNESMGEFAQTLPELQRDPEQLANYISLVAEQERRWLNQRLARSQTIGTARELLLARQFETIASRVQWPVKPSGYAVRRKHAPAQRAAVLGLSDLHVGALLPGYENPEAFDFTAAGRRLARLALETAEFKTQYRDRTRLVLLLSGDVIEGLLGWNDQDNAPLAEQMVAFAQFGTSLVTYLAAAFPEVDVVCEPGNHGRNKLRHQGRATSSKWDSFETVLYQFIRMQCVKLENVRFDIPKAPNALVKLFDKHAVVTHGDTDHKLGSPGSKSSTWEQAVDRMNSDNRFGVHVDLFFAGHFHEPRVMVFPNCVAVANGALVPGNGHARTAGYSSVCGQWLWEAVPGFAFGDSRFLRVGPTDDADASLDQVIPPFRWE
jgi:hypothetical protein